ncbi:lipase family protein [Nocardioides sp. B-3]|uniref:lipase family protein n=1 Tax=Nocardioides sp. B-3 TaxID=2895565 RepID=UPI0021532DA0|nr:lipase family protein [Nocardioides sp. B-3]UUZ58004.1 lipase family protein [Nocardioides sp. B-3]
MASAIVVVSAPTTAHAVVEEAPRPAFYEAPATLPATNGAVIRTEPMSFLLDPLDATSPVTNAKRVLYKTTNRAGKAIAVSGVVPGPQDQLDRLRLAPGDRLRGRHPGHGRRLRPLAAVQRGLLSTKQLASGHCSTRGYAVALTDYEGLGTAGIHTYMDRVSQGRAVLDVIRAAQRISGTGLSSTSPVGLEGYSQGGGAAASAAELAATYAPELRIKGAVVGAVPADLNAVAVGLDGGLYSAFAFFALRGLAASYDVDTVPYLNAEGVKTMQQVEQDCVFDLFGHSFVKSETLSYNGKGMSDLMALPQFAGIIADQRIGTIKPSMPVLVLHSALDDVIPFAVGKTMAKSWCGKGANVRFTPNVMPGHVGGYTPVIAEAAMFFENRFAGLPQWNNCWTL